MLYISICDYSRKGGAIYVISILYRINQTSFQKFSKYYRSICTSKNEKQSYNYLIEIFLIPDVKLWKKQNDASNLFFK